MAAYRTVAKLSPEDAAYIAGLIDGEGTLSLTRRHKKDNRQFVISIANTERPLLDYVIDTIGAGKITGKRATRDNHTPSFTYAIENRQALALLKQIAPYLRTYKSKRARLILDNYVRLTPRNGHYSNELKAERTRFEQQFLALKAHT